MRTIMHSITFVPRSKQRPSFVENRLWMWFIWSHFRSSSISYHNPADMSGNWVIFHHLFLLKVALERLVFILFNNNVWHEFIYFRHIWCCTCPIMNSVLSFRWNISVSWFFFWNDMTEVEWLRLLPFNSNFLVHDL